MNKDSIQKDTFIELYFNKKLSFKSISNLTGYSVGKLHRWFHKFGFSPIKHIQWNTGKNYHSDNRILNGCKHPRWIDGRTYSIDFKIKKKEIINGTTKCMMCGQVANTLHHFDINKKNNNINNLCPLCSSCHTTIHNHIRYCMRRQYIKLLAFIDKEKLW